MQQRRSRTPRTTVKEHESRRLRDLLGSKILWGAYPDGFLPGESALMVEYGASRGTVRDALDLLRRSGVVVRQQGTGTFIVARAARLGLRDVHGLFGPEDHSMFDHHLAREIDRAVVAMPEIVASHLGVEAGAPCLRVEYVDVAGPEPMGLATNYVTYPEAASIEGLPLERSWYGLLFDGGLNVSASVFVIGCANADEHTAALLEIDPGQAVMTIEQVIRDAADRAFNFAFVTCRGGTIVSKASRNGSGGTVPDA